MSTLVRYAQPLTEEEKGPGSKTLEALNTWRQAWKRSLNGLTEDKNLWKKVDFRFPSILRIDVEFLPGKKKNFKSDDGDTWYLDNNSILSPKDTFIPGKYYTVEQVQEKIIELGQDLWVNVNSELTEAETTSSVASKIADLLKDSQKSVAILKRLVPGVIPNEVSSITELETKMTLEELLQLYDTLSKA